ncbi:MAG: Gfo/Idh/MocA family oxidoreductase [Pirellulaceae bacterium]|nr:Gfo/Idh/MocA family oxidoreductase [Pirellulaceae bacterium]
MSPKHPNSSGHNSPAHAAPDQTLPDQSLPARTSRRSFLKTGGSAALAFPTIVSARALGLDDAPPASDRIVMGAIGTGGRGRANLRAFLAHSDVQVVAVCDVDLSHAQEAKKLVDEHYGNTDCKIFENQLLLLREPNVEAVVISTPDHWHGISAVQAAREGKDIYCEKPLAGSIGEGRAICDAVNRYGNILQTGSQERSNSSVRFACELVLNGRLGDLKRIVVQLPTDDPHHKQIRAVSAVPQVRPVPEGFNYDRWLGHTANVPYIPERVHRWWRFISATGGGEMTDRGAHVIDLAQMFTGYDGSGPVLYSAEGKRDSAAFYDTFFDFEFLNIYPSGLEMIGKSSGPRGLRFEGTDGSLFVHVHGGKLEADPANILTIKPESLEFSIGRSPGHHRNFLDCVRSRQQPIANHEVGRATATVCHINNIAMQLGRQLQWNPLSEQFNDDEANSLVMPAMREPYSLQSE